MDRVNAVNIGAAAAQGVSVRADVGRLAHNNNPGKAGHPQGDPRLEALNLRNRYPQALDDARRALGAQAGRSQPSTTSTSTATIQP